MKRLLAALLVMTTLWGCTSDTPLQPRPWASQALKDAWELLDIFFVFRDRLPAEPRSYNTPVELYRSVREPYTVYYTHQEAQWLVSALTSVTVDIGARLESVPAGAVVREIYERSPAATAGIRVGDTLLAVDGKMCAGQPLDTVWAWVSGEAGQIRHLLVGRSGGRMVISVSLAPYHAPTVYTDSLDSAVAYIALEAFFNETVHREGSAGEFHDALARTAWARYTILDLRGNTGGYLSQCIRIAGEFVPLGTAVIRSTERELRQQTTGSKTSYYGVTVDTVLRTDYYGAAQRRRCYVLVDSMTASASEVLLSCLHDRRATDITSVGTRTYGKARGQVILGYDWETREFLLTDRGLARITNMLLAPLAGVPYDSVGIIPHVPTQRSRDALDTTLAMIVRELGRTLSKSRVAALRMPAAGRRLRYPAEPLLIDDR